VGAIDLLRQQHREVEQLFEQLRAADRKGKVRLLGKLAEDLTVHSTLEEKYFYPLAERIPELAGLTQQARREHDQVKRLLSDVMELKTKDPRIDQLISEIERNVKAHVAEEERELFPRLEADAGAMAAAGEQMKREQDELRGDQGALEEQQLPQ
jgi:hemerythrin superfamily protein